MANDDYRNDESMPRFNALHSGRGSYYRVGDIIRTSDGEPMTVTATSASMVIPIRASRWQRARRWLRR